MIGEYSCNYLLRTGCVCGQTCRRPEGCHEHWKAKKRIPCKAYSCNYLLMTGDICGRTCHRDEGCFEHLKAGSRVCGKPTSSKPGLCRKHASGYYVTQYINRLRDRAMGAMVQELGYQIAQESLNRPLTYEQLMNRHRDRLTKLNISICWECFLPIGLEEGEHCNECVPL